MKKSVRLNVLFKNRGGVSRVSRCFFPFSSLSYTRMTLAVDLVRPYRFAVSGREIDGERIRERIVFDAPHDRKLLFRSVIMALPLTWTQS